MRKETVVGVLAVVGIALLIHVRLLMSPGSVPYADNSDALLYGSFSQQFVAESFADGSGLPLWNPFIWSGTPVVGNTQMALHYPPAWLFLVFPYGVSVKLFYVFHTAIAGVLMYFLCRELRLGNASSVVGGIIFMTTGSMFAFNAQHFFSNFVLWLPGVMLFYLLSVRKKNVAYAVVGGVFLAVQFLGCHPQLFFLSCVYLAAFVLFDLYRSLGAQDTRTGIRRRASYAAVICVTAVGLASVELWSMIDLAMRSTRSGASGLWFASNISIAPGELLSMFLHPAIGGGQIAYIGFLPLFLVIASLFACKRGEYRFFLWAGIVSLLFALGKYSPVFYAIYYAVPVFRMFRNPYYAVFMFGVSASVVSAYGFQYVAEKLSSNVRVKREAGWSIGERKLAWHTGGVLSAVVIATVTVYFVLSGPGAQISAKGSTGSVLTSVFGPEAIRAIMMLVGMITVFVAGAILLGRIENGQRYRRWIRCAAGLVAVELVSANLVLLRTSDAETLFAGNRLTEFLAEKGRGYRVLNMGGDRILCQTIAARYGIRLADGYDPIMLGDYQWALNSAAGIDDESPSTKLRLTDCGIDEIEDWTAIDELGVKYLLSESAAQSNRVKLAAEYHDVTMYAHNKGMHMFPVVYVYENPRTRPHAWLSYEGGNGSMLSDADGGGTVDVIRSDTNECEVAVNSLVDCTLRISETWHPGWRAKIDGRDVEVTREGRITQGAKVPSGQHRVTMIFRPASYTAGKSVTLASMGLCVFVIGGRALVRRKP